MQLDLENSEAQEPEKKNKSKSLDPEHPRPGGT
jgi:hypothetical protein